MNSAASLPANGDPGLRQQVRRPRDSDGVGCALRQVFGRPAGLPADISTLLARLDQSD